MLAKHGIAGKPGQRVLSGNSEVGLNRIKHGLVQAKRASEYKNLQSQMYSPMVSIVL